MKKIFILILLFGISTSVFSEGISGIFGINFGTNSTEVKELMTEKGWNLSKTDGTTQIYKKNKGTYANLTVDEIELFFFEDKLYDILISFPMNTKIDDIISSVKAIQETYSLTQVSNDSTTKDGIDIMIYAFTDPKLNIFRLVVMGTESITISSFNLTDFTLNSQKKAAEDKIKQEETAKKNKSISSDL